MGGFDKAIKTCGEYIKPVKQATLRLKELEQSVKQRKHELKVKEEEEKIKRQLWREGKRKIPSGLSMKD